MTRRLLRRYDGAYGFDFGDRVADDGETMTIRRRRVQGNSVAMPPAGELSSLQETAHLLRSPKNAHRLRRKFQLDEAG